jgi:hypothetical protein
VNPHEAIAGLAVIEAARQSAADHRAVPVASTMSTT